ncbi:hypothetical protein [Burkholderia gladioli]|uniref:hypothetical protein n=1 Tax=Burkholderia gladioli TaxID=28095 RepID=UPI001C5EAD7C|nr:hypothetical protein [Burkholderia gladioli]MBW5284141.1 hypothetical protein [Burkholderia gladioli]
MEYEDLPERRFLWLGYALPMEMRVPRWNTACKMEYGLQNEKPHFSHAGSV